ncbi:AMP-binding enzyme [Desulfosoma caldarium]|uniref:AMP-binding enzyme n=1 Tax=Desulfosoma caldarium TaxID=610254 RepID=UPI000F4751F5
MKGVFVTYEAVAEAAVVVCPHDFKGQSIYACVTLVKGMKATEVLGKQLVQWVPKEIEPIATWTSLSGRRRCPKPCRARSAPPSGKGGDQRHRRPE